MYKLFFEVFPTLKFNKELTMLFQNVEIIKLSQNTARDRLKVYIKSDHIIEKQDIYSVEREIMKQLFSNTDMCVVIYEKFELSSRFNVRAFMEAYKESILEEFKHYNQFDYLILYHADYDYPEENILKLTLDDTLVAREHKEDIVRILEKILNERCNLNAEVYINYKKPEESKARANSVHKISEEITRVVQGTEKEVTAYGTATITDEDAAGAEGINTVNDGSGINTDAPAQDAGSDDMGTYGTGGKTGAGSDIIKTEASVNEDKKPDSGKKTGEYNKKGYGKGGYKRKSYKESDNPDVIFGRDFDDEPMQIIDLEGITGEVTVYGKIIRLESRETKNGKLLVIFDITDNTDTITVKMFPRLEQQEKLFSYLKEGNFILIKAVADIDKFDGELSLGFVNGIKKALGNDKAIRMDTEPVKRVELHCHTKMSDMDAVSDVADIMKRVALWGHKALAITDHGVVQAFTDAFHALPKLKKEYPDFKLIYGVEGYLVDDSMGIVANDKGQVLDDKYVVFDIETTGFSAEKNNIIEIGAVKVEGGKITDKFSTFVNPKEPIPYRITQLTTITDSMVEDAPFISEVLPKFLDFIEGCALVAHNARFDVSFIRQKAKDLGIETDFTYLDTVAMARAMLPELGKFQLQHVAKALKVPLETHHRAVDDAGCTAEIFVKLVKRLKDMGIEDLKALKEYGENSVDIIRKSMAHHVIILAKNEVGRINLYKLVSWSHLKYFRRTQRIPKSLLQKYREGLIIGSACSSGELYRAILDQRGDEELARIADFYDYLEVQPLGNNEYMINDDHYENVNSKEDLININKKIIALGEKLNKPVVATSDVHFLDPEDEVYRRIIMAGKDMKGADEQPPLYLKTTEEMMNEFDYIPYDKAYEIVVENTNLIADMVDYIEPVRPDKCPPVIADSDRILRDICYNKAHEMYGEELPVQVSSRLERELNSIISNGFAVMYIIAQKLVWKSMEDGYLVGSRGSVGSSFVATMAGITEVNPLAPHYLCPECHYVDFESEEVKAYSGRAGCDMPDKLCPKCGHPLNKEGFDIPFETFLGFKGDKEPDIDLNFSGEYQSKAHKYTEVIFGDGQTFRAGTIGTLADKTAYGYVKNYYEERGIKKRPCEINRITMGCTGIHRTTGQHPGGIIVLPVGDEIYSFTPIQHPANDMETDIVTTHFDYHSIDHNLLKLDILGHDDPTMIRMLQDLTGTDPQKVALDDKDVMSLFQNTSALKIEPSDIGGTKLGTLGIPEFGTDFAMQMVIDTKPQAFSDLVRIAGLSHGTDVWLGNAQTLIEEGKATIATCICTRDDIMTYLIGMGLDSEESFKIMENVRKGKVAGGKCEQWPAWKEDMEKHSVPDWYIWSCEKIKYMFPKAHAAAYVMMAWRIAYYKVNYPLAYYAAFYSIRASGFSYEKMCLGRAVLEQNLADYKKREDTLTKKEQDELKDMRLVQEMYARGIEFMPIDLFKAQAHKCRIIDGKIMPHLGSIEGLGDKAADAIVDACKDGPFISRDDFRERTKVSNTVIEKLSELRILDSLPASNQLSLSDFFALT
ncbi:MAG: PolC-type DNA polymerase III [Lachnospiraceae bacterium]|nr:PolC-type DNA polymerase III [Lachnospiraceae bacterium]